MPEIRCPVPDAPETAQPIREAAAELIAAGIRRHVNGTRGLLANQFAISTVARQLAEEIEGRYLAESEQLDIDFQEARDLLAERDATIDELRDLYEASTNLHANVEHLLAGARNDLSEDLHSAVRCGTDKTCPGCEVERLKAELEQTRMAVAQHVARLIRDESGPAGERAHEWLIKKLREQPTELHPEDYCHRCSGPNISWSAPSPLWNEVMRGGDINGPWQYGEIICPTCFAILAEAAGVAQRWRVYAERVNVPLATVTPSGRVWNPETWLWEYPPAILGSQVDAGHDDSTGGGER